MCQFRFTQNEDLSFKVVFATHSFCVLVIVEKKYLRTYSRAEFEAATPSQKRIKACPFRACLLQSTGLLKVKENEMKQNT